MKRALITLPLLFFLTVPAPAAGRGNGEAVATVLLVPLPGSGFPADQRIYVSRTLAGQIEQLYPVKVVWGPSLGRAIWGEKAWVCKDVARKFVSLVGKIKSAYGSFELDSAVKIARKAGPLLDQCGADVTDQKPLVEYFLYGGLAELVGGHRKSAARYFAQLVRLAPSFRMSRRKFPPYQRKFFDRTRRRVLRRGKSSLAIDSVPGGAAVFVDGRRRGTAPVQLRLPAGRHFVRLELEEYAPWAGSATVTSGGARLTAILVPPWSGEPPTDLVPKSIAVDQFDETELAELRLIAGFYQAGAVVLGATGSRNGAPFYGYRIFVANPESVSKARIFALGPDRSTWEDKLLGIATTMKQLAGIGQGPVTAGPQVSQKTTTARAARSEGASTAAASPFQYGTTVTATTATPAVPQEPFEPESPSGKTVWYKSWWFWTIVGVAVAGAGTGVALWLMQPESTWTLVVQPR
ncbi:MAG: PEGA domain-containing protein [Deltaproteobacteria bacterium]|nr:MAG: PEGA domain-containing protein [Deltaproteobacteria bacterium]